MNTLFYTVLNMSAVAAIVTVFVVLARLLLKKSPKIFSFILWSAVLFRLLCPVSFSLPFSAVPESISGGIFTESGIKDFDEANKGAEDRYIQADPDENTGVGAGAGISQNTASSSEKEHPKTLWEIGIFSALSFVWLAGTAAMALCSIVSFAKLKKELSEAVLLRENIYISDKITTPFVTGIFSPKIYLPISVKEEELEYIILHERCHIKRGDHIVKLISFALLCIHWFNPFIWLAFCLSNRDMEMSCDEAVMKKMKEDVRASYSQSLLSLSAGRPIISGTPLAFGESSVKQRIKNIMKYKKPAVIISVISAILIVVLAVVFIGNPMPKEEKYTGVKYRTVECFWLCPASSVYPDPANLPEFLISSEGFLYEDSAEDGWYNLGKLEKIHFTDSMKSSLISSVSDFIYDSETKKQAKTFEEALEKVSGAILRANNPDLTYLIIPYEDDKSLIINVLGDADNPYVTMIFTITAKDSQDHPDPMGNVAAKDALSLDEVPNVFYIYRHSDYDGYVLELWETDSGMGYTLSQEQKYHGEYRYKHVASKFYPNDKETNSVILCDTIEINEGRDNFRFDFAMGNIPYAYEVFAVEKGNNKEPVPGIDIPLGSVAAPETHIAREEVAVPGEGNPFGSATIDEEEGELQWFYINSKGEEVPINPAQ